MLIYIFKLLFIIYLIFKLLAGLLHRVILISGCALNSWVAKPSCKWNSFQLARVLGFTGNNDDIASATSVLKNAPAIELFKKMNQVYTNGEVIIFNYDFL